MAASPQPRVGIQPAPFSGNIALISITGPVTLADGTKALHAILTFNSLVPQIIAGQAVQPLVVSTSTDANGEMAISLPQGLFVQITVSDRGVTYPPMNALLPLLSAIAFDQLPHLNMVTGVPEAPNWGGPWARMGTTMTWVATPPGPSQTSGNLAYNPATNAWVVVYPPATTQPPANMNLAWNSGNNAWEQITLPALYAPPATGPAYAWDADTSAWVPTVFNPPTVTGLWGWNGSTYGWGAVMGQAGSTDGSYAAAGNIGECIEATQVTGVPIWTTGAQTWIAVAQANLSPGDWDVSASITFNIAPATSAPIIIAWAGLSNAAASPNLGLTIMPLFNTFDTGAATITPKQVVSSTATVIYLMASIFSPVAADDALGDQAVGFIHARRLR